MNEFTLDAQDQADFCTLWFLLEDHVAGRESISFAYDTERGSYNIGEKFALVHSEVSEALEAVRKNLPDDHLPDRPGGEVECADAIIRMMGIARHEGWDIPGAIIAKARYNDTRADHQPEARSGEHGKRF